MPLYVSMAVASGFVDLRVRTHARHAYERYIPGVLDRSYGAPGIYRVLIPYTLDAITRITRIAPETVWLATRWLFFLAAFVAMHVYLRTWFETAGALLGVALVGATLPLTFTNSWAHPDHIPELALFTAGCWAIARNRFAWLVAWLVLATLNRETAVFLVLLYALVHPWTRDHLARVARLGAVWATVFVGLRLALGVGHYDYWQLGRNLEFLKLLPPAYDVYYRAYAYFGLVLAAPFLIWALVSLRRQPSFCRRALLVVPPFVLVSFTISSIIETRIFTPLYPLVLPGALCAFLPAAETAGTHT
jgi:hypothetical protein